MLLRRWLGNGRDTSRAVANFVEVSTRDAGVAEAGGRVFALGDGARWLDGLPHPDWAAIGAWVGSFGEAARPQAWLACERAWLAWLASVLGGNYRLYESPIALLLTTQSPRLAQLTLDYVAVTARRVRGVLEELAQPADLGKELLIVFDDDDTYYTYLSGFYPEGGEYAQSSGVHLDDGCAHYATCNADLHAMEPVIAHEMTHGFLGHLPLPTWLDEGIAVNVEQRLTRQGETVWESLELMARHRTSWSPALIQMFWSGETFCQPGEASTLSYDLARLMVNAMAGDWSAFKRFVADADRADAGAAAADRHLELDLGRCVQGVLEVAEGDWSPAPSSWHDVSAQGDHGDPRA